MGVRFQDLDPQYKRLIERIVAVNADEGRTSTVNFDYSRPAAAPAPPPAPVGATRPFPGPPPTPGATRSLTPEAPAQASRPAPPPATPLGSRQVAAAAPRGPTTAVGPPPVGMPSAPAPVGRSGLLPAAAPAPDPPVTRSGILPAAAPSHAVQLVGRSLRIVLGPATAAHFTSNPLLNVRSGGFFIPLEEDVSLGTLLDVEIADGGGRTVVTGKGKVVAKQQLRVGVRLSEIDKDGMARLQGEVAKLSSAK